MNENEQQDANAAEEKGDAAAEADRGTTWQLMLATDPGVRLGLMHQKVETLKAVNGDLDAFKAAWAEIEKF